MVIYNPIEYSKITLTLQRTMKFIFWLRTRNANTKKIHGRITIKGVTTYNFSTEIDIEQERWLGTTMLINPIRAKDSQNNEKLRQIESDIMRAYNYLVREELPISPKLVHALYIENRQRQFRPFEIVKDVPPSIITVVDAFLEEKLTDVGIKLNMRTYKRYITFKKHFVDYLKALKKLKEPITEFNAILANGFILWLKQTRNYDPSYANKHKDLITGIIDQASSYRSKDWVFQLSTKKLVSLHEQKKPKVYLSRAEIEQIENTTLPERFEKVRDLLMMLVETGLHIADYKILRKQSTYRQIKDGIRWVRIERQKNNNPVDVIITDKALGIIEKYGGLNKLPYISGQKCNDYLKNLAEYARIQKNLSTKLGRTSFADFYMNIKKFPPEVVSRMLGHSSLRSIGDYADINIKRINDEFLQKVN
jgi:integrase